MEDNVLLLMNKTVYPAESEHLQELGDIMEQLGFETQVLYKESDTYKDELVEYVQLMMTKIDCKAVITCNAAEMERFSEMPDCLYITYLKAEDDISQFEDKLKYGNQNTVIFCSNPNQAAYIKDTYKNIGDVLHINLDSEKVTSLKAKAAMAMDIQDLIAVRRGQSSALKLLIQRALQQRELNRAEILIAQYKNICPADLEVISMETMLYLYSGNLEKALQHALKGVRRYPGNGDMHYNLGRTYESREEWFLAWISYGRSLTLYLYDKKIKRIEKLKLQERLYFCRIKDQDLDNRQHADYEYWEKIAFGLQEKSFRNSTQVLGKYYWESLYEKKYAGIYENQQMTRIYDNHLDLMHSKGEFIKVTEGTEYYIKNQKTDVILPIAVENDNTVHRILHLENEYRVRQSVNRRFNYYRIPPDSRIVSSGKSYYGKPIPLRQEQGKKKLVLNIFVDGLAQCILDGDNFKKIMPYTAAFFGKGTVCTRAYSAAEWTYPSIASYVTGLNIVHHMLYHNQMDISLPEDCPVLNEYFHDDGYYTAELTGNWRAIPMYGYCRGCDQYVYQNGGTGFLAKELPGEMIDHMEAFKETNQVLGVCFGDLHDIGDGFELPESVQSHMDVTNCVDEEVGATSVKQEYSENKRIKLEKMASRLDVLLNIVYQYIESNYKNEDILVSLYADHGQGYLVPPGAPFWSDGRARVAFMFRGDGVKSQVCDEVISACDYIKIMCSLAGIRMKDVELDGVLPKTFGGTGRKYAITESLHPEDCYNAVIYAQDCIFHFKNSFPVQNDGRFYLRNCEIGLTDLEGNRIDDNERCQKYLSVILEHIAPLCIYN